MSEVATYDHGYAVLKCQDPICGGEFRTPLDIEGDLLPDGINRHDDRFHDDGSTWDFRILRRETPEADG